MTRANSTRICAGRVLCVWARSASRSARLRVLCTPACVPCVPSSGQASGPHEPRVRCVPGLCRNPLNTREKARRAGPGAPHKPHDPMVHGPTSHAPTKRGGGTLIRRNKNQSSVGGDPLRMRVRRWACIVRTSPRLLGSSPLAAPHRTALRWVGEASKWWRRWRAWPVDGASPIR